MSTTKKAAKKPRHRPLQRTPGVGPYQGTEWRILDGAALEVVTPAGLTLEISPLAIDALDQVLHVLWFPGGRLQGWQDEVAPSVLVLKVARYPGEGGGIPDLALDWVHIHHARVSLTLERFADGCKNCSVKVYGHTEVWTGKNAALFVTKYHGTPRFIENALRNLKDYGKRLELGAA